MVVAYPYRLLIKWCNRVNHVNIYPVIELKDIYYGYRYGWLNRLFEVTDTVMLRPEVKVGKAFKKGVSIKTYLIEEYSLPAELLKHLKIMLDHGIFVDNKEFERIFGVYKSPSTLINVYNLLKVNYGLAYDVPSMLHVEIAVKTALSKITSKPLNDKVFKALYPRMVNYVNKVCSILLTHIENHNSILASPYALKQRMYKLIRQCIEGNSCTELRDALYHLSEKTVEETLRNLEQQLKYKVRDIGNSFKLVPVVQGLFEEHVRECTFTIIELLISYGELLVEDGMKYTYISIGTGGKVLSTREAKVINKVMKDATAYAKKLGVKTRFHILGWTSPKMAEKLKLELVYSGDSLTPRRRATEGKVYVLTEDGKLKLLHVAKIKRDSWKCACPVCKDMKLRHHVLEPLSTRKNHARMVHNLWVIKQYITLLKSGQL